GPESIPWTRAQGSRHFQGQSAHGYESVLQRLDHEGKREQDRSNDQAPEREDGRLHPEAGHQPAQGSFAAQRYQQIETQNGRRKDQRDGDKGFDDDLESATRMGQPPSKR